MTEMKHWKTFRGVAVALCAVALFALPLSGCGKSGSKGTVNVYNWGDYIDESVIKDFESKTGIKVNYETFSTNEDMYVKLKAGSGDYDVVVPSDYTIKRMMDENMLAPIDFANVPNYKEIGDQFKNLDYDPENKYSVPYMWGTVGILYNKKMVTEPVDSWKVMWDTKYKKQILMMDSQRDSIGVALKYLGFSLNTHKTEELEAAKKKLIEQKPLVLSYVVDEGKDKMIAGEAAMMLAWSGDALFCMNKNKDLSYAIPKEGSNLWFDAMAIPKGAKNKKEAEAFINYMCEADVAAKNAEYIGYSTPHMAAREKLPEEIRNNHLFYPSKEETKNLEIFVNLGELIKDYDRIWTEIKSN